MAYPYRSILAPIELEDPSFVALNFAQRIATDHQAVLHVLHVVARLPAFGERDVVQDEHSVAEERAHARLRVIAGSHLSNIKYQLHTAAAGPRALGKAILQVAAQVNADLIVLKTSGRKGLSNFILGNVSEEIVRTAPCPVLTLAPTALEKAAQSARREVAA
jgi:nucleotide-binding universal stress UspA family protein